MNCKYRMMGWIALAAVAQASAQTAFAGCAQLGGTYLLEGSACETASDKGFRDLDSLTLPGSVAGLEGLFNGDLLKIDQKSCDDISGSKHSKVDDKWRYLFQTASDAKCNQSDRGFLMGTCRTVGQGLFKNKLTIVDQIQYLSIFLQDQFSWTFKKTSQGDLKVTYKQSGNGPYSSGFDNSMTCVLKKIGGPG